MKKAHDKAYAEIARSCLKVLNNLDPGTDRQQQIEQVYAAIDQAVSDLYKQQEQQLAQAYQVLGKIAELDSQQHNLNDAIQLAKAALPTRH